jgi:hypothetical protein
MDCESLLFSSINCKDKINMRSGPPIVFTIQSAHNMPAQVRMVTVKANTGLKQ